MANPILAIRDYFRSSIAELKKVTWPSRDLTIRYSLLVIVASTTLALFFATLDYGLSRAVTIALTQKTSVEEPVAPPVTPDVTPTVEGQSTPINVTDGGPSSPAPTDGGLQLPPLSTPNP